MITFARCDLAPAMVAVAAALPCAGDVARLAAKDVAAFTIDRHGAACGALVLGSVADGWGHDLVVYAAAGQGGGLTEAMHDFTAEVARGAGLNGVRCFTARSGLVRRLERLGWTEATRMLRRTV